MSKFHTLSLRNIHRLSKDSVRLDLEIPESSRSEFSFIPGQYITFKHAVADEELRRSYSICSVPEADLLSVAVKEVPGGRFSGFVNKDLSVNARLEVMPPEGNFTLNKDSGHHFFVAAGSGITPMMSMIPSLLKRGGSKATLLFGNKTREEVMFASELEELARSYSDHLEVLYAFSREEENGALRGRVTKKVLDKTMAESKFGRIDHAYLCGPADMIFMAKEHLAQGHLGNEHIHFELFTVPLGEKGVTNELNSKTIETSGGSRITFRLDGEEFSVEDVDTETPILDIALEAGIDAPFACQGGVCCTCKALVQGEKVDLRQNFSLSEKEVEEGYVLTCQSYHLGGETIIDYDS